MNGLDLRIVAIVVVAALGLVLGVSILLSGTPRHHKRGLVFFVESLLAAVYAAVAIGRLSGDPSVATGNGLYIAATGVFILTIFLHMVLSLISAQKSSTKRGRKAHKVLISSIAAVLALVFTFNLLLPLLGNFSLIWLGPIGFSIVAVAVYVATLRYELFAVRPLVIRVVSYCLIVVGIVIVYLVVMTVVYKFLFKIEQPSWELYSVNIIMIIIVVMLLPLINEVNYFLNKFVYDDEYNVDELVRRVNQTLLRTHDMEQLLSAVAKDLNETLSTSYVYFTIFSADGGIAMVAGQTKDRLSYEETKEVSELVRNEKSPKVMTVDEVTLRLAGAKNCVETLQRHRAALVAKLVAYEGTKEVREQVVGFVLIGHKERGRRIIQKDIDAISTIANLVAIAAKNIDYYSKLQR